MKLFEKLVNRAKHTAAQEPQPEQQPAAQFAGTKVSIIITMYRARHHLETCLRSIAEQSFLTLGGSVEVLCFDDGSGDGTADEARGWLARLGLDGEVFEQANTGSPATGRNLGIDRASGEFLFFVDVDDHLAPAALTLMVGAALRGECDVVVGKYVGVGRPAPKMMFKQAKAVTDFVQTPALLDSLNMLKLFRVSFLRERLPYRVNPRLQMCEDVPFMLAAYLLTERVAIVSEDCYYWVRDESLAQSQTHLTQRIRTPEEYWRFVDDAFDMVDALGGGHPARAERMRELFWNRLLSRTVLKEMRYKRSESDRAHAIDVFLELMQRRRPVLAADCRPQAKAMLRVLQTGDHELIRVVAEAL